MKQIPIRRSIRTHLGGALMKKGRLVGRKSFLYFMHGDINRSKGSHSCESRNPEKRWIPGQARNDKPNRLMSSRIMGLIRFFPRFHNGYGGSSSISPPEDRRRHATSGSKWYISKRQIFWGGGQWGSQSPGNPPSSPGWG